MEKLCTKIIVQRGENGRISYKFYFSHSFFQTSPGVSPLLGCFRNLSALGFGTGTPDLNHQFWSISLVRNFLLSSFCRSSSLGKMFAHCANLVRPAAGRTASRFYSATTQHSASTNWAKVISYLYRYYTPVVTLLWISVARRYSLCG